MKKILCLGVATLCSLTLVACAGNNGSKKSENISDSKKIQDSTYFKKDTLKINMATLKILSTEVLPADENLFRKKPQLAITYEVTNNSDEPISASTIWIACMGLTQDTENTTNKLTIGMTPQDEKFIPYTEHELDDINPKGIAKAIISYDLDDTETPVLLKATQGIAGKKLGEKTINLK
ncbi:DUF5067 domain-containing protein [Candidatus Enterococcus ikei]|uniref:DUF5067 domain-containing protein n=1 Tax=Candidatus Enterococcus ikei TaxID=2815326 RepID=A0ABS3GXU0_9ENTE|nr:DUF5067 domain-containing protein [Enterococcus sp. DIV0869a]MBO0439718.1 DUF5067 domain-containing protein [Enterococcus sp. DIV0869a]